MQALESRIWRQLWRQSAILRETISSLRSPDLTRWEYFWSCCWIDRARTVRTVDLDDRWWQKVLWNWRWQTFSGGERGGRGELHHWWPWHGDPGKDSEHEKPSKSPPMANEVTFLSQMTLSSPPANYATTSANIINTLPQVQRLNKNILRQTLTKTEAKIKEYFLSKSLFFRCQFQWVSSTTSPRCQHPSHYPCQPHYQLSLLLHSRYLCLYLQCICISTVFWYLCLQLTGQSIPVTVSNLVSSLQTPLPQSSFLSQVAVATMILHYVFSNCWQILVATGFKF